MRVLAARVGSVAAIPGGLAADGAAHQLHARAQPRRQHLAPVQPRLQRIYKRLAVIMSMHLASALIRTAAVQQLAVREGKPVQNSSRPTHSLPKLCPCWCIIT